MISKKWAKFLIPIVVLVIGLATIQIFIAKPESNEFNKEKQRLVKVENELNQAIVKRDTLKAKTLIIQLRWQYEPSTIGGQSEADALRQTWNAKRKEYLILIGEDPDIYNFEIERRGLKSQWDELINK